MSTKQKHKKRVSAQGVRKVVQRRSMSKNRVSKTRLSGRGRTANAITTRDVTPHLLAKQFAPKSEFSFYAEFQLNPIVESLYKCLKTAGFNDDKAWTSQPTAVELADYLFGKIKTVIPEGYEWSFRNDELYYYKSYPELENYYGLPLEWLPAIERENQHLFNLIIATIYYISKTSHLDLFQTRYEQVCIDNFEQDETSANDPFFSLDVKRHKRYESNPTYNGICIQYLDAMHEFATNYSKEEVIEMIKQLDSTNPHYILIIDWLQKGIYLLENPIGLDNYTFFYHDVNEGECGDSLGVNDYFHFVWSFHDAVFAEAEEYRNALHSEFGSVEPVTYGVYKKSKHIPPADLHPLKQLIEFMKTGRDIYFDNYDKTIKQFYDNRSHNQAI